MWPVIAVIAGLIVAVAGGAWIEIRTGKWGLSLLFVIGTVMLSMVPTFLNATDLIQHCNSVHGRIIAGVCIKEDAIEDRR
jgi:hypothetical protein